MTRETLYTRRTTLGLIAALPMVTANGRALARTSANPTTGSAHFALSPSAGTPELVKGRPRYHIAAPAGGWINDPQRPLKIGDTWTLWALYNPTYPTGGTNWRRWTSKDLVTWEDRGIAIPRNTNRFGDVWSGSTVVDTANSAGFGAGVLVTLVTMPVPGTGQSCALWYSRDGGASFAFHDIVLANPGGHKDFRDPTVFWHAPTNNWVMTLSEEGKIGIYTSTNLKHWTYTSGFASTIVGNVMECSHLFKLHLYEANGETSADKWVLLVGGNGTKLGFTVGGYYWIGDFDGTTFTSDALEGQWIDGGADFYAAVVWTDPAAADPLASAYSIAWMSNWDYVNKIPVTRGYRGQLSLVRQLRLQRVANVPRLLNTPLAAQNKVFAPAIAGQDQTIARELDYVWPAGAEAAVCRIDLTFSRIGAIWPDDIILSVRRDDDFATRFLFTAHTNTASLHREKSGPNVPDVDAWRQQRSVACDFTTGSVSVSLFIDAGSVELFVNDGIATISELITAPLEAKMLNLSVSNARLKVLGVSITPMN